TEFEQESLEDEAPNVQREVLASYAAFVRRAVRARKLLASGVLVVGTILTIAIAALYPRTYHCETKLMAQAMDALKTSTETVIMPFDGAGNLIMRHENLITIVQQAELAKDWAATRPPIMKLKDRLSAKIHGGSPTEADIAPVLVGFLESRLWVS